MAVVWQQVKCWTTSDSKVHGSPNAVSSYNFELTQLLFCCRQRAQCWPSERDRHRWRGGVCVLFSTSQKFELSSVWLLFDFTFRNFHAKLTPSRIMTRYCMYGLFIWIWNNGMLLWHQEEALSLGSGFDSWSLRRVQAVQRSAFILLPACTFKLFYFYHVFLVVLCEPNIRLITDTTSVDDTNYQ